MTFSKIACGVYGTKTAQLTPLILPHLDPDGKHIAQIKCLLSFSSFCSTNKLKRADSTARHRIRPLASVSAVLSHSKAFRKFSTLTVKNTFFYFSSLFINPIVPASLTQQNSNVADQPSKKQSHRPYRSREIGVANLTPLAQLTSFSPTYLTIKVCAKCR